MGEQRASTAISHQWRLRYHRPAPVGFTGVALAILGFVMLTASPFLLVSQQMNGNISYIPGVDPIIVAAGQSGFAVVLCALGFSILRAKNWARWGYVLLGAGVCGYAGWQFRSPWVALGVVIYLGFAVSLFGTGSKEFFRLFKGA